MDTFDDFFLFLKIMFIVIVAILIVIFILIGICSINKNNLQKNCCESHNGKIHHELNQATCLVPDGEFDIIYKINIDDGKCRLGK